MNDFQHKPAPKCKHRWRTYREKVKGTNLVNIVKRCMMPGCSAEKSKVVKPKAQLTERKKRINPVSTKRDEWNKKYQAACRADASIQICAVTGVAMHSCHMDRHHPYGRLGAWIMMYIYVSREEHNWIHANAKESRELGWLQDSFFSYPQRPNQPEPWGDRLPIKKP